MHDYQNLKKLLENETFPHTFIFKFIGKNTSSFQEGVNQLTRSNPELVLQSRRETNNTKYISFTYVLIADSAESIIEVFQEIHKISDILMIL